MSNITPKQFSKRHFFTCALLLLALGASVAFAFNPRASAASTGANLSTETRALIAYGNELFEHDVKVEQLTKKATLTAAEVDAVNTKAADLKRRLPQIQQTFRSIIDKLKAANEFNNFDSIVFARIKDERKKASLREDGGPKRRLETLASDIPSLARELDAEVQGLRSKLRAQIDENLLNPKAADLRARAVRVASTTAAPVIFRRSLRCAYWNAILSSTEADTPAETAAGSKAVKYCNGTGLTT
jgi:hypothetical protein